MKGRKKLATYDIHEIKKLVIIGMFSDDVLMEQLVVKGGNALDIILEVSTRASVDVDFSLAGDLPEQLSATSARIEKSLRETFAVVDLVLFDFQMSAKPAILSADVADFWGGYGIEFKLIERENFEQHKASVESLRRNALPLGQGTKFLIDISRFEYTIGKEAHQLDGFRIYAYSPAMITCEKLRAICQQMPDYSPVIHRGRHGTARARDFLDLHTIVTHFNINLLADENIALLRVIFEAKKVPLKLLGNIGKYRDFHESDWPSVRDTVKAGKKVNGFDFYFDFVLGLAKKLEPFWNK